MAGPFEGRMFALKKAIHKIAQEDFQYFFLTEVGVYRGEKAVAMMNEMVQAKKGRPFQGSNYLGFDLFEDLTEEKSREELSKPRLPPRESQVRDFITLSTQNLLRLELIKGDTVISIPHWVRNNPPLALGGTQRMDLIFLDGGHSIPTIRSDWDCLQPLIGPDTIVVLDDYYDNRRDYGCRQLVDEVIIPSGAFNVEIGEHADRYDHTDLTIRAVTVTRKAKESDENVLDSGDVAIPA